MILRFRLRSHWVIESDIIVQYVMHEDIKFPTEAPDVESLAGDEALDCSTSLDRGAGWAVLGMSISSSASSKSRITHSRASSTR